MVRKNKISRRNFCHIMFGTSASMMFRDILWGDVRKPKEIPSEFIFTQLQYRGGDWNPNPTSALELISFLKRRTSIESPDKMFGITLLDPDLFHFPFLYVTGKSSFLPFNEKERENMKRYIDQGGTVLIDDGSGLTDTSFDGSIKEELTKILPGESLRPLPWDHTVFRSFYLIRILGGRRIVSNVLTGITRDDLTPVIYSRNDLSSAWAKSPSGEWIYDCVPGGEWQRDEAFKLGVNVIMYALTANYKQDQIHSSFIQQYLRGR